MDTYRELRSETALPELAAGLCAALGTACRAPIVRRISLSVRIPETTNLEFNEFLS